MIAEENWDCKQLEETQAIYFLPHPIGLQCSHHKQLQMLCINQRCISPSLFCKDNTCKSCKPQHQDCNSINLSYITSLLNQRVKNQIPPFKYIADIDLKLIRSLHRSRQEQTDNFSYGLPKRISSLIQKIYKEKDSRFLKGKSAKELFIQLQSLKVNKNDPIITFLQQTYEKTANNFLAQTNNLKENLSKAFCQRSQCINNCLVAYQSFLTDNKQRQEKVNFLWQALNRPLNIQLLFRASEYEFSCDSFHQKCDNIPDTLTILRTQFGKTIGGFSHYPWTSDKKGQLFQDKDRNCFIFSMQMKQKFVPRSNQKLILRYWKYGPTFGQNDLLIEDRCNKNRVSMASFPSAYNRPGKNKIDDSKESYQIFTGSKTAYFKVLEYEVYKVLYQ